MILDHHGGDHEDVANAAADGHRRQQEEPRHPGPRGGQCDRGNIEVTVHALRLVHPYLRLETHNPSSQRAARVSRSVHSETGKEKKFHFYEFFPFEDFELDNRYYTGMYNFREGSFKMNVKRQEEMKNRYENFVLEM